MSRKKLEQQIAEDFDGLTGGEIYYHIIQNIEKIMIERALEITGGNKIRAAGLLGINRNTLLSKIRFLKINAGKFRK